jgi:methyl-accepting chemotaxis protein
MRFARRTLLMSRGIATRSWWAAISATAAIILILVPGYLYESNQFTAVATVGPRGAVDAAVRIAAAFEQAAHDGRMTVAQAQEEAKTAIGTIRGPDAEVVLVTDATPKMILDPAHPERDGTPLDDVKAANGTAVFASFADLVRRDGQGTFRWSATRPEGGTAEPMRAYVRGFAPWGWIVSCQTSTGGSSAMRWRMALIFAWVGLSGIAAIAVVVHRIGRDVAVPLRDLAVSAELLSQDDLAVQIDHTTRRDELGALAHALDSLRRRAVERAQILRIGLAEQAAKERRQAAMDRLTQDFSIAISGALTRLSRAAKGLESESAPELVDATGAGGGRMAAAAREMAWGGTHAPGSAAEIREVVADLRDEVDQFIRILSRGDEFRRRYERIPGHDAPASLIVPNETRAEAAILDISRGGAALRSAFEGAVGEPVLVALPGAAEPVSARVVRHAAGIVAVAFRQDDRTMTEVDTALDGLSGTFKAA